MKRINFVLIFYTSEHAINSNKRPLYPIMGKKINDIIICRYYLPCVFSYCYIILDLFLSVKVIFFYHFPFDKMLDMNILMFQNISKCLNET